MLSRRRRHQLEDRGCDNVLRGQGFSTAQEAMISLKQWWTGD
jgi:hypothetical protein